VATAPTVGAGVGALATTPAGWPVTIGSSLGAASAIGVGLVPAACALLAWGLDDAPLVELPPCPGALEEEPLECGTVGSRGSPDGMKLVTQCPSSLPGSS
jgi:hypothetical protein